MTTCNYGQLNDEWYVVRGNVEYNDTSVLSVNNDVKLILEDDSQFKINITGITINEGKSLTIYVQSTGSSAGTLISISDSRFGISTASSGKLTIN